MKPTSMRCFIVLLGFALTPSCAGTGTPPASNEVLPPLKVARLRAADGDFPALRAVDPSSLMVFRVYHDTLGAALARTSLPDIADMYRELSEILAVDAGLVHWSAAGITSDSAYVPPRHPGEVRWTVLVDSSGQLASEGDEDLYRTLPHEQVHAIQGTFSDRLPRWFSEGMAEWAGLHVTSQRAPALAAARRTELREALESLDDPLDLPGWGAVIVKREAILHQVTPEQRARMETDPTYMPPGPFRFGPADLTSDEANTLARYAGALGIFEMLERSAGQERMRTWFRAVWRADEAVDTAMLAALAREHVGVDIQPWLDR